MELLNKKCNHREENKKVRYNEESEFKVLLLLWFVKKWRKRKS